MKRQLIIAFVTLLHLALIALLLKSCDLGKLKERSGGGKNGQENDASENAGGAAGPSDAAGGAAGGARVQRLDAIPFTYVERPLSREAEARQKACRTGILIDWDSKDILWRKNADQAVPVASMTKMMTALLLADRVAEDPAVSLSTRVPVTRTASKVGGSQVYLDPREALSLDDLLKCIMIFSANDAAQLVAEYLGNGSVDTFVKAMNDKARLLGMPKARFVTPHGLPGVVPGTDMATATEMAFLASLLLERPEVVKWSSTRLSYIRENSTQFKPFQLVSRNALITTCPGVNGMKTGFTNEAGFCVAATCERGKRRMIAVVTGCSSSPDRDQLVKALFDWGYGVVK